MAVDLKKLIGLVKTSRLLGGAERKDWLTKMETMKEEDLKKLESILENAETIDMDKAIREKEEGIKKAEEIAANAEKTIESMVLDSYPV